MDEKRITSVFSHSFQPPTDALRFFNFVFTFACHKKIVFFEKVVKYDFFRAHTMGEVVEHEIPHTGKKYQCLYVVRKHRLCCVRRFIVFLFCFVTPRL